MADGDDRPTRTVSRRTVLAATGSAVAVPAVVSGDDGDRERDEHDRTDGDESRFPRRCPDATIRPNAKPCPDASTDGCADDHPETRRLRERVEATLESRYPDVGAIIEQGYKPYFDAFDSGEDGNDGASESDGEREDGAGDDGDGTEGGWSHWLNPEFIGDDETLNPDRPESILVDNEWWRPIGVMFIATREGEPIERPPAIYGEIGADEDRCSPWHSHVGLPGRFAWWYYRQVYEGAYREGELLLPCETPCAMHVWTVPHPEGVHAHGGPPAENRGGPPAEDPGFETDARPGEDELGWDVLPDEVVPETKPEELRARFGL